ncbi:MAG: HAD family hydrolase [Fretibacterium sp.]|nr:HAD family hydrolase [Fretibacterium sp.]
MINLLIFDHDMTLVDSSDAILAGVNLLADVVGKPHANHSQVMRCIAMPLTQFMEELFGECRPEWLDIYRQKVAPLEFEHIHAFPETGPVLTRLREMGVHLGVASNRQDPHRAMEKSNTARYFDPGTILGPADKVPHKPHPAMIESLMEHFGVPCSETAYVGDSDIDIRTALAAGVRAIGITRGYFTREQFSELGAWRTIDSLTELLSLVRDGTEKE